MQCQPQGCSTSPNACDVITTPNSAHQPLPGEMLADGCSLGDVDGTVTANLTVPWSPSGVPPGVIICDVLRSLCLHLPYLPFQISEECRRT